jgi:DNA-binding NtrC family response regulator
MSLPETIEKLIDHAAGSNGCVLIRDDDSLERRAIAVAIHERSARRAGPFLRVPSDPPDEPSEPERFDARFVGYERRAFTGAPEARPGLFEVANGGTVFIDDVARLDLVSQWLLFHALESGTTVRLGGTVANTSDVRIIYGTGDDLRPLVKAQQFRMDLFTKLSPFAICVGHPYPAEVGLPSR